MNVESKIGLDHFISNQPKKKKLYSDNKKIEIRWNVL